MQIDVGIYGKGASKMLRFKAADESVLLKIPMYNFENRDIGSLLNGLLSYNNSIVITDQVKALLA